MPETPLESPGVSAPAETTPQDTAPEAERAPVDLGRISWLFVTVGLSVGVLILLLKREWGYAAVSGAVAISAAINLL
jgi:hypothetical protein